MDDLQNLLFPLARLLSARWAFDVRTDAEAIRLFLSTRGSACPGCGGARWTPTGDHHVDCVRCGVVSVYRGSALGRRRIPTRTLLAALFVVWVDTESTSARAFGRKMKLRAQTAWALLHEMRAALPVLAATEPGLRRQLLGAESPANRADVVVARGSGRVTVLEEGEADAGRHRRELSLVLGMLRAWLATVFRGVTARHLGKYLAEFSARQGRVVRHGGSHV